MKRDTAAATMTISRDIGERRTLAACCHVYLDGKGAGCMRRGMIALLVVACMAPITYWMMCQKSRKAVADTPDLLPGLIQGCKDAVAAIKSGKGTVTVHSIRYSYDRSQKVLETERTYTVAFEGPKYRISGETLTVKNEMDTSELGAKPGTKVSLDLAYDGEKLLDVDTRSGTATLGSVRTSAMGEVHSSLLVASTLVLRPDFPMGHGVQRIDFYPLIDGDTDKGLRVARRESLDGHECIVVERTVEHLRRDGTKLIITREYWVDPERGFTVPRRREWLEGGSLTEKSLLFDINTELRGYGNGLWGPAKHTYVQNAMDGKGGMRISFQDETTYSPDYQLNVPVTADDLTIKLPPDAYIKDLDAE
jgi:hypothetical protein